MKKILFLLFGVALSLSLSASTFSTFNSRTDFRDESIYFLMTTRFYDGDSTNNVHCWDAPSGNYGDPEWRGDFKGLIERLDYIKALGFTAIWITPVVTNASGYDYHGYHALDFSTVDKRYETHTDSEDVTFRDVVNAVHARGMKIILDIVLNHTGNFGEENLCKEFTRDWTQPQQNINQCMIPYLQKDGGQLPDDYASNTNTQYAKRLALMKNTDGVNHDTHNYWHHFANFNWDDATRWFAQIAGDCVDLNTENPAVYNYLVRCYSKFIAMGVDGFRIDTSGHMPRLTFNNGFLPGFQNAGTSNSNARNVAGHADFSTPFFMFGEVCAREASSICYRNHTDLSPYYYTWAENTTYAWDTDSASWDNITALEGDGCTSHTNWASCWAQDNADKGDMNSSRLSQNALLSGNTYHTPDHSQWSGMSVIDFPMHWSFQTASGAFNMANPNSDQYYNDATYNVVYVDSHDYGPNSDNRFDGGTDQWAENMDLMFTYRGIPCVYYGSEVEFQAGKKCDNGTNSPLHDTGRAYYGGYMTGSVTATGFGQYTATGNAQQSLNAPLSQHLRRLNAIRQEIPALRKGQYSKDGCSGSLCFKRRYTNGSDDSFVLVTISGNATFSNLPAGTYVDAITGDSKTVAAGGSLTTSGCSTQGNMRVYVLNGTGKIGSDEYYLYGSSRPAKATPSWDGQQMATTIDPGFADGGTPTPEPTPAPDSSGACTVYYAGDYTIPYVWAWNAGPVNYFNAWPGAAMTNTSETYNGKKVWKYEFTWTPTYIIFSDKGKPQTADLTNQCGKLYNGSTWVDYSPSTGVEQMEARTNTGKILVNGRVYLIRDGQLYDMMGRKTEIR